MIFALLIPSFIDGLQVAAGLSFVPFIVTTLCLFTWLVNSFASRKRDFQFSPVFFLLLLIGATAFLSITSLVGSPFTKLYRAVSFSYTRLFMVFLVINLVDSIEHLRRAMYIVIGLAALSASVSIWQFWAYQQWGINYSFAQGGQTFRVTPAGTFVRATGLASDPNEIGMVMAVAGVWCLVLGLSTEGLRPTARVGHMLVFLIITAGVAATVSRVPFLALLIVSLAVPFVIRPHWTGRVVLIYGVLTIGAIMAAIPQNLLQIFGEDPLARIDLVRIGMQAFLENALTGVGIATSEDYNNPYDLPPGNLFVHVASELGIGGLFFFILLIGYVAVRLGIAAKKERDAGLRCILVALTLGYMTQLIWGINNILVSNLFFWFYVGLNEGALIVHRSGILSRSRKA